MKRIFTLFLIVALFVTLTMSAYAATFYSQNEHGGNGYCWACSYAMLLSDVTGNKILPEDVAAYNISKGVSGYYCYHSVVNDFGGKFVPAIDISSDYYQDFLGTFNGMTTYKNINSNEDAIKIIKTALDRNPNGVIIRYNTPQHSMVAVSYENDIIYYNDPAKSLENVTFSETCIAQAGYKESDMYGIQAIELRDKDAFGAWKANNSCTKIQLTVGQSKIIVNGKDLTTDVSATIVDDRVIVPLRAVFEAMDASVDWDPNTKTVVSKKNDTTVSFKINSNVLVKNGTNIEIDVPPQIINDRAMVPVRAIAESYGADVAWNSMTKTVTITM